MNTAKLSKKDRLESRPQGILPTPLDPASPQARAHEWDSSKLRKQEADSEERKTQRPDRAAN